MVMMQVHKLVLRLMEYKGRANLTLEVYFRKPLTGAHQGNLEVNSTPLQRTSKLGQGTRKSLPLSPPTFHPNCRRPEGSNQKKWKSITLKTYAQKIILFKYPHIFSWNMCIHCKYIPHHLLFSGTLQYEVGGCQHFILKTLWVKDSTEEIKRTLLHYTSLCCLGLSVSNRTVTSASKANTDVIAVLTT